MNIIKDTEKIVNPLQESALNKKGLCDYVINVASGCLHGCSFCYVPSTPAIRARQTELKQKGIVNPQMDWGNYLLVREEIPEILEQKLARKKTWRETPEGKGVVLLCSGTDPYQNAQTAAITRKTVKVLLKYNKRVRILTRGLLWLNDLDILKSKNVTVGMSLPFIDDKLGRTIERNAPLTSQRYEVLLQGSKAGCRTFVALAPTPPSMKLDHFKANLEKIMVINPEVIFWEPINARGTNGKRMIKAGVDFAHSVMNKKVWESTFIRQWDELEKAAKELGCLEKLHIWPDPALRGCISDDRLDRWLYKPTIEKWDRSTAALKTAKIDRARYKK
ncbi:MAG: radical SAM protein [Cyanobacteria bacterium SBLK]|nr:radical SAM protein [Cyanobacteria bacterium SBLK]